MAVEGNRVSRSVVTNILFVAFAVVFAHVHAQLRGGWEISSLIIVPVIALSFWRKSDRTGYSTTYFSIIFSNSLFTTESVALSALVTFGCLRLAKALFALSMYSSQKLSREKKSEQVLAIGASSLFLLLLAFYHVPGDAHVPLHDNLDSHIVYYEIISARPVFESGKNIVPNALGGIPRACYPSSLELYSIPFRFVSSSLAFALNDVIMRMVAFAGLFLLLRFYCGFIDLPWVNLLVSGAFSLLPVWPNGFLGGLGIPLLAWAILNITCGRSFYRSAFYIGIFPFGSSLIMAGVPLLACLLIVTGVCALRYRSYLRPLLLIMGSLILGYVIVEHQLLHLMLFDDEFISHRSRFTADWFGRWQGNKTFSEFSAYLLKILFRGTFQSPTLGMPVILPVLGGLIFLLRGRPLAENAADAGPFRIGTDRLSTQHTWTVLLTLTRFIVVGSFIVALHYNWYVKSWILSAPLPDGLRSYNFSRISLVILPCLYVAFAFGLKLIDELLSITWRERRYRGAVLAIVIAAIQLLQPFSDYTRSRHRPLSVAGPGLPVSFDAFYATPLFERIRSHIDKPNDAYGVVSIGMPANVALYNGFHIRDGYFQNYPLAYKLRFRNLIGKELAKSPALSIAYDSWGSWCYIRPSEWGRGYAGMYRFQKTREDYPLAELALSSDAFAELGIDYILSAVEIENHEELGLEFEEKFWDSYSAWTISLYSVKGGFAKRASQVAIAR